MSPGRHRQQRSGWLRACPRESLPRSASSVVPGLSPRATCAPGSAASAYQHSVLPRGIAVLLRHLVVGMHLHAQLFAGKNDLDQQRRFRPGAPAPSSAFAPSPSAPRQTARPAACPCEARSPPGNRRPSARLPRSGRPRPRGHTRDANPGIPTPWRRNGDRCEKAPFPGSKFALEQSSILSLSSGKFATCRCLCGPKANLRSAILQPQSHSTTPANPARYPGARNDRATYAVNAIE